MGQESGNPLYNLFEFYSREWYPDPYLGISTYIPDLFFGIVLFNYRVTPEISKASFTYKT